MWGKMAFAAYIPFPPSFPRLQRGHYLSSNLLNEKLIMGNSPLPIIFEDIVRCSFNSGKEIN